MKPWQRKALQRFMNKTTSLNDSHDDHNSEEHIFFNNENPKTELAIPNNLYNDINLNHASVPVLRHVRGSVPPETLLPATSSPYFRFLDVPLEVRREIYELVLGNGQRIHITSYLGKNIASTRKTHKHKHRHKPNPRLFPDIRHRPESNRAEFQSTASTIVCHDMQNGKQQITTNDVTSYNKSALYQDRATGAGRWQDLRLLRTCRQIYDEARCVLYGKNKFVFLGFASFAGYFGIVPANQVSLPRSTKPNRLRAIHLMTQIEIQGQIGDSKKPSEYPDFLSATRLIRTGLDCLTSLTSLELKLEILGDGEVLSKWRIDDCIFSKPSTLRKLTIAVQAGVTNLDSSVQRLRKFRRTLPSRTLPTEDDKLEIAKELMHRLLRQEGFGEKTEYIWRFDETVASGPLMKR